MEKRNVYFSKPSQEQLNSLLEYYQAGRYADAEKLSLSITQEFPEHQFGWKVLGAALKQMGKINESLVASQKSLQLEPQDAEAHSNLGVMLKELHRLDEAETSYRKAIKLKPDYAVAHSNLGVMLQELGKLDEAEAHLRQAIKLKPDYAVAHNNLGVMLKELRRLDEAETSYRKAITLKPDYAEAHSNLGVMLKELRRLDEAETSYKKAITLKPDYAEAHSNLGVMLQELGKLDEAEAHFRQAIKLKPDLCGAWDNLYFTLHTMKLQTSSIESHLPLLDEQVISKYAQISKSILNYRLNQGSLSSEETLNQVINILSSTDNTFVKNPKMYSSELIKEPTPPKKITALVHFGRSGTGLLHSLIDGHPEISTLPSIYFSEFFDHFTWKKITAGGWEEMADRFVSTYEVLFDASSTIPIATIGQRFIANRGQKEGMTIVGVKKNEILSVDKEVFIKELKRLVNFHNILDQFTFFKLVHSAYDKALNDHNKKNLIFYHIHNPSHYAKLNFLRLAPSTNWLMMVREPIQSCESWIRLKLPDNYTNVSNRIFQMLFEVDSDIFQNKNSVGVRLEDLKQNPKKTIKALCNWLDIKENDSLYEMTAQSKKWWGDPTSPDYEKEGMDPFGKTSIKRKLGSVFSENDQYILSTLFYPFSVRFNYVEENLEKFKNDLQIIRPMLDQMFDFEKKMVQNKKMNKENFMKSSPYLFLRSGMIERWNTLNTFHTYPNMLTLLDIN
jgi:Flp pilus assembly protein TadD